MGKFMEMVSRMVATRGWEKGEMGSFYLMGTDFQSGMLRMFCGWTAAMVVQQCKCTDTTELYT